MRDHAAVGVYFLLRVASALLLLKLSTQFLSVQNFANFAQFLAFAALLNMIVVGGAQNGLIREAAAAATDPELNEVHGAGLAIWLIAVPVLAIPAVLLSRQISHVLTGTGGYSGTVIGITLLALAGGPGQICWSILSGRNLVTQSLGSQAFGTLAGTAAAGLFIIRSDFVDAALAFSCGPLIATIVSIPFIGRLHLAWKVQFPRVSSHLRYSAAMAATVGFSTLMLFSLRWFYRDRFGATELGYWLAANRISDMSTQLLALFLLQLLVPQLASAANDGERARLLLRYGIGGALLTGAALAVFLTAGGPLVHLFLSDAYVPAIPAIRLYMVGDFFRVWVSLAMFTAFAAGRPGRYAAIEISTLALMGLFTVTLCGAGEVRGPQIAYAAAYGVSAAVLGAGLLLRMRPFRRSSRILSSQA